MSRDGSSGERGAGDASSRSNPDDAKTQPGLTELYRDHWRELCRYIASAFGQGPPEPEDVAQLAFARVAALENYETLDNPKAYLWRTARNIVLSEKRSLAVRQRNSEDIKGVWSPDQGDELTPERVIVARAQISTIVAALDAMPAKRRRMLVLNRVEGLSIAEIARRTGLSPTAVWNHIARAMVDIDLALDDD